MTQLKSFHYANGLKSSASALPRSEKQDIPLAEKCKSSFYLKVQPTTNSTFTKIEEKELVKEILHSFQVKDFIE